MRHSGKIKRSYIGQESKDELREAQIITAGLIQQKADEIGLITEDIFKDYKKIKGSVPGVNQNRLKAFHLSADYAEQFKAQEPEGTDLRMRHIVQWTLDNEKNLKLMGNELDYLALAIMKDGELREGYQETLNGSKLNTVLRLRLSLAGMPSPFTLGKMAEASGKDLESFTRSVDNAWQEIRAKEEPATSLCYDILAIESKLFKPLQSKQMPHALQTNLSRMLAEQSISYDKDTALAGLDETYRAIQQEHPELPAKIITQQAELILGLRFEPQENEDKQRIHEASQTFLEAQSKQR